jgi:integrase
MAILAECPTCHHKQAVKNKRCKCGEFLDKAKQGQKVKYWIQYRLPNGKQKKESVGSFEGLDGYSIKDANDAHAKRKVQKREKRLLDSLSESETTFKELCAWFLDLEKVKALEYYSCLERNLKHFNSVYGEFFVDGIKPSDIEDYQQDLKGLGLSDSYVDQKIGAVKTMINKAFDNDMVSGETVKKFRKVKKLLKRNSNARDRVLNSEEFDNLMVCLSKLPKANHLCAVVATAYYTGMRRREILSLTWDKVDLQKRIIKLDIEDTKDREVREIPICNELLEIFSVLPNRIQESGKDNRIFLYQGKPVADLRTGLKNACKDAGILYGRNKRNGFTFHDLRHTFNTNMRRAGIAESVIMEITGHSTREMFDRYNTVDADDRRGAIDQMEKYLGNLG